MGIRQTVRDAWQSQLAEWLRLVAVAAVPSLVAGFSYARGYRMTIPILVGAGVFVLTMLAMVLVRAYRFFRTDAPVTVENIEARVQEWADTFRYGIQRLDVADRHFTFKLTVGNATTLVVSRPTVLGGRYLQLERGLSIGAKHQPLLAALPLSQQQALASKLRLHLATANVEFAAIQPPLHRIDMNQKLPITRELTEWRFVEGIIDLAQAWTIAREVIVSTLEHGAPEVVIPGAVVEVQPASVDPKNQS